jgi:hypothetical protein
MIFANLAALILLSTPTIQSLTSFNRGIAKPNIMPTNIVFFDSNDDSSPIHSSTSPISSSISTIQSPSTSTTTLTGSEWLKSQPDGAYTTARTCLAGTRIFEWSTHTSRTSSSAVAMGALCNPVVLEADMTRVVTRAIASFKAWHKEEGKGEDEEELRLTLLATWPDASTQVRDLTHNGI